MNWMDQIGGMLQRYSGGGTDREQQSTERDFDEVARVAPPDAMSQGLAEAFRSKETPPFPSMLGQMFGNASGDTKANLLNTLIAAAGPSVLSGLASQFAGGGLGSLASKLGTGQTQLSPQDAEQVSPEAVQQLAAEAEKQNPNIIEQISGFAAQNPALLKTLGVGALGVVMSGLARRGGSGQQP